jgi:Biopolymer transport protein
VKLSRTTNYNFGWLLLVGLVDLAFLLAFFLLLSSNLSCNKASQSRCRSRVFRSVRRAINRSSVLRAGSSRDLFSGPAGHHGAAWPLLDAAKRKDQSIIIKADRSASYETVAEVTNAALEHGITSVALAATPPR